MLYFNLWGISTLLSMIFMYLLGFYLLLLKNKQISTRYLGYFFIGLGFLNLGYFLSAIFPTPLAANHRYITVLFILFPTITVVVQYAYHVLDNRYAREARLVLYIGVLLNTMLVIHFSYLAINATAKFNFHGDIYDYPQIGKWVALDILAHIFLFMIIMLRKSFHYKGQKRAMLIQMMIGLLLITVIPSVFNALMKKGSIAPEVYHLGYSLSFVLGSFVTTIVFINHAVEKTSFMTKIIGITLVTFLLFIQSIAIRINTDNEMRFDSIHKRETQALINSKNYSSFSDLCYLVEIGKEKNTILYRKKQTIIDLNQLAPTVQEGRINRVFAHRTNGLFLAYRYRDPNQNKTYEAGFSYFYYREFLHESNSILVSSSLIVILIIVLVFPFFFYINISRPLKNLLGGLEEVEKGNLSQNVGVRYQDEIGVVSAAFNEMVKQLYNSQKKLQEYAGKLEFKVEERTKEVVRRMQEIEALKVHQDGDYFLTSLIQKPLITNWNRSHFVTSEFFIRQKKDFEFRNRKAELGGDICISANLKFGKDIYIFFINGDAMGKSMQGAGGAIVLGTVVNYILARTAGMEEIVASTPQQWLAKTYSELNQIFNTFDGLMMASVIVGLIHHKNGQMYYFNAEHPWTVLYRDKKATFIEEGLFLRKLGSPSEFEFEVKEFQLQPGDVLIAGSDGRDDINFTPHAPARTINEDETLFLQSVEKCDGQLAEIVNDIEAKGEITDDLSLVRIGFYEENRS